MEKLKETADLSLTQFKVIHKIFHLFFQNFSKNTGDTPVKDLLFFEIMIE